jgi:MFS family permease
LQGAAFGLIFFFQLIGGAVGAFAAGTFAELFGSSPGFVATIPFCVGAVFSLTGAGYLVLVRSRLKMNAREGAVAGPIL